jgi:hypothetical protein
MDGGKNWAAIAVLVPGEGVLSVVTDGIMSLILKLSEWLHRLVCGQKTKTSR